MRLFEEEINHHLDYSGNGLGEDRWIVLARVLHLVFELKGQFSKERGVKLHSLQTTIGSVSLTLGESYEVLFTKSCEENSNAIDVLVV